MISTTTKRTCGPTDPEDAGHRTAATFAAARDRTRRDRPLARACGGADPADHVSCWPPRGNDHCLTLVDGPR